MTALQRYLVLRGKSQGFLFCFPNGQVPDRYWFDQMVKYLIEGVGLDKKAYSTHSLRVGATTDMALNGYSITQIKIRGRWESYAFLKYIRPNSIHVY